MEGILKKPVFGKDQIVSATMVSKKFSEIRKRAKKGPLFVSDRNEIDTVIIDYETYEFMYSELEFLREQQLYATAIERLRASESDSLRCGIDLQDILTEEEYGSYQAIDPNSIPDEDLFE